MLEAVLGLGGVGRLDSTNRLNLDFEQSSDTWVGSPALSQSERSQSRQPGTKQLTSQLSLHTVCWEEGKGVEADFKTKFS